MFSCYSLLGNHTTAGSPPAANPSSAVFVLAGGCSPGSACSTCCSMIAAATNSMFGQRSTSFAACFNYKRTFKTNVSLLIPFSNLVSLFCLADVFSLHTHLAILKQVHNRAHFLNKSAQICKL